MTELDPAAREALDTFVAARTPSSSTVAAALERVHARLEAGETVALEDEPARARPALVWAVAAMAVAAAAVAVVWVSPGPSVGREGDVGDRPGAALDRREDDAGTRGQSRERTPKRQPLPRATTTDEPDSAPPSASTDVVDDAPAEPAKSSRARTPRARADAPPTDADATLHAELALLRPAQAALKARQPERALRLLDDHARSFPSSSLAPERTLARVRALCALGRKEEARSAAARFLKAHPRSWLRVRLTSACPVEDEP